MQEGKLTNAQLKALIFDKLLNKRKETVTGPGIGQDCAVMDLGDNLMVISTDPITGTEKDIGKLCVDVCCNDLAAAGAQPVAVMVTCLIPQQAEMADVKKVVDDIISQCKRNEVDLIGGHTEVSSAVCRMVLSGIAIGKKKRLADQQGVTAGCELVMSKSAGLEGAGIIASEKKELIIKKLGKDVYARAVSFLDDLSVVKEGAVGSRAGAVVMHDATEGGVLGCAWEMAESAGLGVKVFIEKIPVEEATRSICGLFDIDPLRLISSGVMLFAARPEKHLAQALHAAGIAAVVIGEFTEGEPVVIDDREEYVLAAPKSDELYKALKKDEKTLS
jgi:hydrogenase maturation factor